MELRQLRYFVKAAELLNFSEAAKAVCVTQSTLSQQIRQLEIELDTQLFERNSHAVALTEEGEALLPAAIKTLYSADTCRERIDDLRRLTAGTLNIGVTYSFSPILTETVIEFMKHYPNVKLNIHYKTMEELMRMLSRREVDFVLAFRPSPADMPHKPASSASRHCRASYRPRRETARNSSSRSHRPRMCVASQRPSDAPPPASYRQGATACLTQIP